MKSDGSFIYTSSVGLSDGSSSIDVFDDNPVIIQIDPITQVKFSVIFYWGSLVGILCVALWFNGYGWGIEEGVKSERAYQRFLENPTVLIPRNSR